MTPALNTLDPEVRRALDSLMSEERTNGQTAGLPIEPDWFVEETQTLEERLFRIQCYMLYYFPETFLVWEPLNTEFFGFLEGEMVGMAWLPGLHGKSTMLRRWMVYVMCAEPNITMIYTEKNEPTALKAARAVRMLLENNKLLNAHFGRFKPPPDSSKPWSDKSFTLAQRTLDIDWPTFSAFGAGGGSVLGSRCNIIVVDDPVTPENSLSEKERDKLAQWYADSASTSAYPLPVAQRRYLKKQFLVGTVFRLDDLYHTVKEAGDHSHLYLKAVQDEITGATLSPRFAFIDPKELDKLALLDQNYEILRDRIASGEVNNLFRFMQTRGRASFNRRFQNVAINEEDQWCQPEWIYGGGSTLPGSPPGGYPGCLEKRRGMREFPFAPDDRQAAGRFVVVTGCDPQSGSKSRYSKNFALVTLGVDVQDPSQKHLLDLRYGQYPLESDMPGKETQVSLLVEQHRLYGAELVIENNAVQVGWQGAVKKEARRQGVTVSVRGHYTDSKKEDIDVGVRSMAPMLENGYLRLPALAPSDRRAIQPLIDEIIYYGVHPTSDLVMALWFAYTRIEQKTKAFAQKPAQVKEAPYINRQSHYVVPAHWTPEQKREALRAVGVKVDIEEEE